MKSPDILLSYWDAYKEYTDKHPDFENVVTVKGEVVKKEVKKPYLKQGFESYVYRKHGFTIKDYLSGKYPEFSDVVTCIRLEWEDDQISGSLTGRYKSPNLVARLNGLKEQTETKTTIEGVSKITIE